MPTIKSAIQEVRDQLFLDRADGEYLSVVTSNLGINRPLFGFANDSLWRAVIRRLALDTRQIENCFRDLLTQIFGPQYTTVTVLGVNVSVDDEELYVSDQSNIPQLGTMIIDETLASAETIEYSFRDPRDGLVSLTTAATLAHTAQITNAESRLVADASATDTVIVVRDSTLFPTTGFPYPILIEPGANEEVVEVTSNVTGTGDSFAFSDPTVTITDAGAAFVTSMINGLIQITGSTSSENDGIFPITGVPTGTTLEYRNLNGVVEAFTGDWTILNAFTVSALANDHGGPTVGFASSGYDSISTAGLLLTLDDTSNFPSTGLIRIQEDAGATVEDVEYVSNSETSDQLNLKTPLQNSYTDAEVTLLERGASVQLSQVKVLGADWDIFQTEPRVLTIYLPEVLDENRLQDATFLHGTIQSAAGTTVSGAHSAGATLLEVADASTFPDSGAVDIDSGTDKSGYTILRISTILYSNNATGIPIGTGNDTAATPNLHTLIVEDAASIYAAREITRDLIIDRGGTPETVTWTSIDLATNEITLESLTTVAHATGDVVEITNPGWNTLRLFNTDIGALSGGEAVAVIEKAYGGTDLEDGRSGFDDQFSGSYLWSILDRVAESTSTTLAEDVAGPTYLVASQSAGRTALEVKNAALFNSSDPQQVRIGRNLAGSELRQINSITLMRSVSGVTVNGAYTALDPTLTVSGASGLPDAYGYRIFVDDNVSGTAEEVALVRSFSGTTVVLDTPLVNNHSAGDNVQLMADVLEVDTLTYSHAGSIKSAEVTRLVPLIGGDWATSTVAGEPNSRVALIEEVREYIDVITAADFTAIGGYAQINFGRSITSYESQLAVDEGATSATIDVEDGSGFPATDFFIHIGEGTRIIETIKAASIAGNTITLTPAALLYNHRAGEWVRYFPGEQEQVTYNGTETGANERLTFSVEKRFSQDHLEGEPVALSGQQAIPTATGTDFPAYLPSRWQDRIEFLINLARAAGVKVVVTSDR